MFTFFENQRPDLEDLEDLEQPDEDKYSLGCYCPLCGASIPDDEINEFGTCAKCFQAEIDQTKQTELLFP